VIEPKIVDDIPREKSGKYRIIINKVNQKPHFDESNERINL